jgi:hypothetical protein
MHVSLAFSALSFMINKNYNYMHLCTMTTLGTPNLAVVDRWSLFRGKYDFKKWDPKMVVTVGRWFLFGDGR